MQDICEEASLSPGAVYRYFRSKEEIIEAMCARGQDENGNAIQSAMSHDDTLNVFEELIRTYFIELESFRSAETCALNVELISEAPRNERIRDSLTKTNQQVRGLFTELINRAQQRGEINASLDPESVARVMVALYQGFVTQKLVEPGLNIEGYAAVARALFAGLFWQGEQSTSLSPPAAANAALRH
jgi:AcrR family transcriptional regulator